MPDEAGFITVNGERYYVGEEIWQEWVDLHAEIGRLRTELSERPEPVDVGAVYRGEVQYHDGKPSRIIRDGAYRPIEDPGDPPRTIVRRPQPRQLNSALE